MKTCLESVRQEMKRIRHGQQIMVAKYQRLSEEKEKIRMELAHCKKKVSILENKVSLQIPENDNIANPMINANSTDIPETVPQI